MGLMSPGMAYRLFSIVARYQYSVADVIGVQTPGNLSYFSSWRVRPGRHLEVLQNWLDAPAQAPCSIDVQATPLSGRRVFVYAGNMGVAQGMDILLAVAQRLRTRIDVGFLFVGRGSEVPRLRQQALDEGLDNVHFCDEIDPDEIPALYAQCNVGIVALDARHRSHNIPGKFLTYMQSGLPVLAVINAGNDLAKMIREERVGVVCETRQVDEVVAMIERLLDGMGHDTELGTRCRALFDREFSASQPLARWLQPLWGRCFARSLVG